MLETYRVSQFFADRCLDSVEIKEYRYPGGGSVELVGNILPELRYVCSGEARWLIGGNRHQAQAGDILVVPAGSAGQILEVKTEEQLQVRVLSIPVHFLQDPQNARVCWAKPRVLRRSRLAAECAAVLRDCLYEKMQEKPAWQSYVAARARLFLVYFHRFLLSRRRQQCLQSSFADFGRIKVQNYIRALDVSTSQQDTMESVAASLEMSPRRFSDLFRQVAGTTWLKYLHAQRILQAKKLLAAKTDSVGMIAFQAGFDDITTFHRVFKNFVGMTPSNWRKRHRENEFFS